MSEIAAYLQEGVLAAGSRKLAEPTKWRSGQVGNFQANQSGDALSFMDFRDYLPGDDIRRIDWGAYARSDKLTLRLYQKEVCPVVDLLIDCSRSMALDGSEKQRASLCLAAMLATAALNGGYAVRTWQFARRGLPVAHGDKIPLDWGGFEFEAEPEPHFALLSLLPRLRGHGLRILVSDLLFDAAPGHLMPQLAADAHLVYLFQVLDPSDLGAFPHGPARLLDQETGLQCDVNLNDAVLAQYRQALNNHCEQWSRAARVAGAVLCRVAVTHFLESKSIEPQVAARLFR